MAAAEVVVQRECMYVKFPGHEWRLVAEIGFICSPRYSTLAVLGAVKDSRPRWGSAKLTRAKHR